MPAVTFTEAARALGFRSRSTLFRLKEAGELADYLRPPSSPGGAQLLELEPRGLPPLREAVARLIRPQVNNCERYRQPRSDPRSGAVAGVLSEALADHGALSLCSEPPAKTEPAATPTAEPPDPNEAPDYNKERALHEREKRLIAEMDRKTKEGQLAYIDDMEMAYNAVLLQLTTKAGSLHKQIKAAIPHLTHRELEKIERMVSDIFESVAANAFEDLPE